jgi:hypothetical protein
LLSVLLLLSGGQGTAAGTDLDSLRWLAGCWASDGDEPGSGEQWTRPAGGSMLGVSRTIRDGKTTAFEFMRIIESEHGELHYIAAPSGQSSTVFVMSSISGSEVIFENPDHDFPQRVAYRHLPDSRLMAWIDGTVDGQRRRVEFPMSEVDCKHESDTQ